MKQSELKVVRLFSEPAPIDLLPLAELHIPLFPHLASKCSNTLAYEEQCP